MHLELINYLSIVNETKISFQMMKIREKNKLDKNYLNELLQVNDVNCIELLIAESFKSQWKRERKTELKVLNKRERKKRFESYQTINSLLTNPL